MPLNVKSIAVNISVIFFFGFSLIGWIYGLSPYVCCKRAVTSAFLAYIASAITVKVINAILIDAMIDNKVSAQKESDTGIKLKNLKAG